MSKWILSRLSERSRQAELYKLVATNMDVEYYKNRYIDINQNNIDPVEHFVNAGWREGRDPAAWFCTRAYLDRYPDVKSVGMNPFVHYLKYGRDEGRQVSPAPAKRDYHYTQEVVEKMSRALAGVLDEAYYRRRYDDIARNNIDPMKHYIIFGWREGRDPAAWFSTQAYLQANSDVREQDINPLYHYVTIGKSERRPIWPAHEGGRRLTLNFGSRMVTDPSLRGMLDYREQPLQPADVTLDGSHLKIHFVIPDYQPGGGGHMTIFRMVRWLEFLGHECTVWIHNAVWHKSPNEARDDAIKWFQPVRAEVKILDKEFFLAGGDGVVATSWDTVWPVTQATLFKERFYLVQDFEPWFYPQGSHSLAAEQTYTRNISCICASPWLRQMMETRYGRWARHFWLAADQTIYKPAEARPENTIPEIAFYSRETTPRRAVEIGLLALEELARRGVVFHANLFGAKQQRSEAPFAASDHEILEPEDLAKLYGNCDIGVCFSTTNYSLVPQEMMACGLAVVEIDSECTRMVFPEGVVTTVPPDPVKIADAMESLLSDRERRMAQADNARGWVSQFSWERAGHDVEAIMLERLQSLGYTVTKAPRSVNQIVKGGVLGRHSTEEPKATVAIPTYNGGDLLKQVIDRIRAQKTPWPFEIIIVDSSSSDGTAEYCRSQEDIRFESIHQREFSHGPTRNRMARMARGEFVCFLTQDAMPADEYWLYELVSAVECRPRAAGGFGHHFAWPEASAYVKRDLENHFTQFEKLPLAMSRDTDKERWQSGDRTWRQKLHFFSDNNSILRRSVWQSIPFPDVDFGEDQMWANLIINAGYEKIYAPHASVYHSHDYDEKETFARCRTEAEFFSRHFGYRMVSEDHTEVIAKLNAADERWGRGRMLPAEIIEERKRLNQARILGYVEGQATVEKPGKVGAK